MVFQNGNRFVCGTAFADLHSVGEKYLYFDEVGFITLAAIYIGMCFHYFIEIRNLDQYGLTYIFTRVL